MKEIKRLYVIQQVEEGQLTGTQAAELLGLSIRQVRRLITKYRQQGVSGLVHGNRGRTAEPEEAARTKGAGWDVVAD